MVFHQLKRFGCNQLKTCSTFVQTNYFTGFLNQSSIDTISQMTSSLSCEPIPDDVLQENRSILTFSRECGLCDRCCLRNLGEIYSSAVFNATDREVKQVKEDWKHNCFFGFIEFFVVFECRDWIN